jgi:NADPH-dependent 2,4-dienoyl-CoA reductase/sulfur reductase-like enzyme
LSLEAGKTGLTAAECEKLDIPYKAVVIKDKNQTDYYPNQEDIWGKILYDPQTKVIIGAQIVGKNGALLRADVMAAAIAKKMTTDELGFLDLIYAPPFSRTWEFLNVLGNVAK